MEKKKKNLTLNNGGVIVFNLFNTYSAAQAGAWLLICLSNLSLAISVCVNLFGVV